MEIGLVKKIDIDQEMQQSYLDYAMSVIVARALPDARDGLKPVQRRILYAMYDMGLRPGTGHRKSARIVGEVLGKYHPHGDVAVYEAMARLAQDFSMRYPLIDGQGNFGSIDGDPPAAMRYTEASLLPLAMELLQQIDRNTVNFSINFDGSLSEPDVLPAAVPNLLLNGATGIAVGMATNTPPHNLGEVIDALIFMLNKWDHLDDINVSDLMTFIKGPDFPTGGLILLEKETSDLLTAYATGRGRITVRGLVQLEEMSRGRNRILITQIPYLVNKTSLIERIAELAREDKIEGIADLRDESDRQGMRIVIELTKTAETEEVLSGLYQRTPLQTTFGITILALVDSEPRLLSLKQALRVYLEHRIEVIRRRSEYDLEKARSREHILSGLRIAINNLDEIIIIIRKAQDVEQAKLRLIKRFNLSEIQATAILDMQLRRLAALERKKIEDEYKQIVESIKQIELLLRSPKKIRQVVEQELLTIRETYGDRRRTQIITVGTAQDTRSLLTVSDLIPAQDVWVGVTPEGSLSRTLSDRLPRIAGKSAPQWLIKTNSHHNLYIVFEDGRAISIPVNSLPENDHFDQGAALSKYSSLNDSDLVTAIFSVPPKNGEISKDFITTVSRLGMIKKSSVSDLPGPSAQPFILAKVNEEDAIIRTIITHGESNICLVTNQGTVIRFSEKEVRPMGLVAAGVNGIKLAEDNSVIGADKIGVEEDLFIFSGNGLAWRIPEKNIPLQGRYGQGVIACKLGKDEDLVGCLAGKSNLQGFMHFRKAASKPIRMEEVPICKRNARGKLVVQIRENDGVYYLTPVCEEMSFWKDRERKPERKKPQKEQKKVSSTSKSLSK